MHPIRIDNFILQVHRTAKTPVFNHIGTAKYRSGFGKKTAMCVYIKLLKKYTIIVKTYIGDINWSILITKTSLN